MCFIVVITSIFPIVANELKADAEEENEALATVSLPQVKWKCIASCAYRTSAISTRVQTHDTVRCMRPVPGKTYMRTVPTLQGESVYFEDEILSTL